MGKLILIRHGESVWNAKNLFTGWVDVPLTEKGIEEAQKAADFLANENIDIMFVSELWRAQHTLGMIVAKQEKTAILNHEDPVLAAKMKHNVLHPEIPVYISRELNERNYGDLQGLNKAETAKKYGDEQVHIWRRSFDTPPPNGESLKDTCDRAIPYFQKAVLPHLKEGKTVLISAHGNSLRGIIKHLENISDQEIPGLELPTGKPYLYNYLPETDTFEKIED